MVEPLKNDNLIRALLKEPVDYTPVWLMRQAGRYLPEYRKIRQKAGDFLTLCKTPDLACEVTLQPLERYALDGAIIFSDILTIPDAMGLGLTFKEGEGPCFSKPIRDLRQIKQLKIPDPLEDLGYVCDAIRVTRRHLAGKVPLIGFAGSPWTLATYMVEGGGSSHHKKIRSMVYDAPDMLHLLLEKLTQAVTDYLNAQIDAGAQIIMLFDSWGGILTTPNYQKFSLDYMQKIIKGLRVEVQGRRIPKILFTKNGNLWLEQMAQSGCDALGVDWTVDLHQARQRVGEQVALQGNLDPMVLQSNPEAIVVEVQRVLNSYGVGTGHVFNLGHGVDKDTPMEHIQVCVDAVHALS